MPPKKSASKRGHKRPMKEVADEEVEEELDEIEEQLRKMPRGEPLFECPICSNEFEKTSKQIRVLPCAHSLCRSCGIELIKRNEQKNTLRCPDCHQPHILDHPNVELDPFALIDRYPTMEQFLNRNEWLKPNQPVQSSTATGAVATSSPTSTSASSLAPSKIFYCTSEDCTKLATHNCLVCGYQCATHEYGAHLIVPRSLHIRVSLHQQKARLLQEETSGEKLKQLEDVSTKLAQIQKWCADGSESGLKWQEAEKSYRDGLEEESKLLADLTTVLNTLKEGQAYRTRLLPTLSAYMNHYRQQLSGAIQVKRDELKRLSTEERMWTSEDDFQKLIDLTQVDAAFDRFKFYVEDVPILPPPNPLMTLARQLKPPSLLPTLPPNLKLELQRMLTTSGKSLMSAVLLYKASWHGWTKDDFIRCLNGKRATLMIVKVEGNECVFGAYIAPAWPKKDAIVPDPSGQSFIFSLQNQLGDHPLRFSLSGPIDSAVSVGSTYIGFGRQEIDGRGEVMRSFNFWLFNEGRPFNDPKGISIHGQDNAFYAYRLDEESKRSLLGFRLHQETFAGSQYCGASEIEVYQTFDFF